jgi:hypothetical protein
MKNENQNDPHRISIINNKVLGVLFRWNDARNTGTTYHWTSEVAAAYITEGSWLMLLCRGLNL